LARDVGALRGASPAPDDSAAGDAAAGSGPSGARLTAPAGSRKRIGLGHRLLHALAALVAVLVVVVAVAAILLYQRLEQGPLSLQPLVPLLEAPIERRLGRPVDIQGLRIAWADQAGDGLLLEAGPVGIGGSAPARADALRLRVGLPLRLQAAELRVTDTDARTLLAAWPDRLAPEAHALLDGMVQAGLIRAGELRYRFGTDAPNELGLQVAAENAVVQLPNGLPKVSGPNATVTIEGGRLRVTAPQASGAGLEARSVDVTVDHLLDDAPSRLRLAGAVEGEAGSLYRLLASPPLSLFPRDLIDLDSLHGRMSGTLDLGLPLAGRIQPDDVDLSVDGTYADLSGRVILPTPVELAEGNGRFSVKDGAILVDGKARLFDAPLDVVLHDRWRGRGEGRRIEARGPVNRALLERFGVTLPDQVGGDAAVEAKLREEPPGTWQVELDADLKDATIREDLSGFVKEKGQPGRIRLSGQAKDNGDWAIARFELEAGSQKVAGSLHPVEAGHALKIDTLVTAVSDLRADLVLAADGGVSGRIDGSRARLPDTGAGSDAAAPAPAMPAAAPGPPTPLALEIAIERVQVDDDNEPLKKVQGHVQRGAQGFDDVGLAFDLGGPGSLAVSPGTAVGRHRLQLTASDAGRLVRAIGGGDSIAGGELKIEADVTRQVPDVQASGRLDLGSTTIRMGGQEPMPFGKIVIPFQVDGPQVTIDQARMTGSVVGLRVSGTLNRATRALAMSGQVTPLYPLNRFMGQIPIIGGILGGSKGLGAINADFTLSGTLDDPKAKLAASSVLVPGVLRDLFRAIDPR
jgi:hypothetical protein